MNKILIIEDDLEINALLADFLKEKGYAVHCQYDGLHVLDFLNKEKIDLIILDIMLPYRSGDIILSDVRKKFTIPVIIISAKETTQNKIDLLRLGADDYITKPFDMEEVLARIESNLRRVQFQNSQTECLQYNNLTLDLINLITENAVALEKENILPEINLPDYSIYVYSDKNMVERILQNLLTNAIKYSVGTIKITLMEKENNNIIFTIENPMSDSSEIDCNRLFDRFYTGDKSRHNRSTGLGLAVVKTLVAILGGNIVAKVHANSLIITLEL